MYSIKQLPHAIHRLKYRPSIEPEHNDNADFYGELYRPVTREFSPANQEVLRQALLSAQNPRGIVEIGVQRNPLPESSTGILLQHKPADCVFIGVDIEDKSHLTDAKSTRSDGSFNQAFSRSSNPENLRSVLLFLTAIAIAFC